MTCPMCGAVNDPGSHYCSQCSAPLDGSAPPPHQTPAAPAARDAMGGAEALAYAGEKTTLWTRDTLAGYSMDRRALDELEAQGQGDSDAADIARRGIAIAKVKWIVGGVFGVVAIIIFIVVATHISSQPTP